MPATKRFWEDVKEGDRLPEVRVDKLTRTDFVKYAGASGDFNPIHHDQTFAEASGNPTVFAMGMLNAGILSRVVTGFAGRPNVRRYKVRFSTRAWPGDDVVCRGTVTRKLEQGGEKLVEGELEAVNQKGETLISGTFVAALTKRIRLGTGIMQLAARTPAAAAMAVGTIDALAGGGRVIAGLGVSGPQIVEGWYGQPWGKPYWRLRDYVGIMRKIFARKSPVQHEGREIGR